MLKFIYDNKEVEVTFSHYDFKKETKIVKRTRCTICVEKHDLSFGYATQSVHDNFDRNVERKIALTRALERHGFSKNFRSVVWAKYFEARNGKKD